MLSSLSKDLSKYSAEFEALGIESDGDMDAIRTLPEVKTEKWLRQVTSLSPLELHILLCALYPPGEDVS